MGGGSLRLLPILRGVFKHHKGVFENGEIRLCDLNLSKAELVGRMIMKTPEYRELSGCEIRWGDNLDEMLKGADLLLCHHGNWQPAQRHESPAGL